jgi:D-alanyl-D-alanine carboxypeptidase
VPIDDEQPVPVESPGGGRIKDKTEPAPSDLVTIDGYGGAKVPIHRLAALFWSRLIDAARIDGIADPYLLPVSGYRSVAQQQQLWQAALEKYGSPEKARMYVAPPGSSAHQSGRAVDCWLGSSPDSQNVAKQQQTAAYAWLVDNAQRFGFYPYEKEPWHWEYNPPQS